MHFSSFVDNVDDKLEMGAFPLATYFIYRAILGFLGPCTALIARSWARAKIFPVKNLHTAFLITALSLSRTHRPSSIIIESIFPLSRWRSELQF